MPGAAICCGLRRLAAAASILHSQQQARRFLAWRLPSGLAGIFTRLVGAAGRRSRTSPPWLRSIWRCGSSGIGRGTRCPGS